MKHRLINSDWIVNDLIVHNLLIRTELLQKVVQYEKDTNKSLEQFF